MKKLCILLLLFLIITKQSAQNIQFYGSSDANLNGLSSNLINQICEDSYGFIWIATEYGLNRFDGLHFSQYLHKDNDEGSLLSNNVHSLMLDRQDKLWVGCNNGLQYYELNENKFKTISFPDNIQPHIADIIELHNGQIWVTTSGWGIFSIDTSTLTAHPLKNITKITKDYVEEIYEDKDNFLWLSLNGKGILRIDPSLKRVIRFETPEIPHNSVSNFVEDAQGKLYISMPTSVCVFDKTKEKFDVIINDSKLGIRRMITSSDGTIYIGTDRSGLKYIDKNNKLSSIDKKNLSENYQSAKVYAIAEDRNKNLWLGCFQKGILMLPNKSAEFNYWELVNNRNQLGNSITSICKDSQGNIWCSIDNDGIKKLNSKGEKVNIFSEIKDATKIFEDSDNTLWITSRDKGLGKLNKNSGKCEFINIPHEGYMKTIAEGKDKHLYISTFSSGFGQYNIKTGSWKQFSMYQQSPNRGNLDNDWINVILSDSKGLIWFGHYKGISCFDPEKDSFLNIKNDVISNQVCISLAEGKNNEMWIGTYNGLFCFNKETKQTKQYTTDNGLSSNVICGIALDECGNIWCSTFNGINKLIVNDDKIVNFQIGNGLIDKIYSRGIYFQDKNDAIYFGGSSGITSFHPENITIKDYNREVFITNLYVRNKAIDASSLSGNTPIITSNILETTEFNLSYEDNTFTIEFSTIDFMDSGNILYEYRLKELGNSWQTTLPGVNQITYNHLNSGSYTLEVRACKYGAYSPVKQFSLLISPPWYKSMWAYLFYLSLSVIFGALIVNLIRKKRNEEINESKMQFFINISHDIRSPLTLIISPLEKLLKESSDPKTTNTLLGIYRNTNRILGLVNQLLDIRKLDKGQMKLHFCKTDIIKFIQELFDIFDYQAKERNIKLSYEYPGDNIDVWIDRNNFDKVLINILSNAFKYTPDGGEICILLTTGKNTNTTGPLHNYLEINIIDSGIGLEENKRDKIFERFYQVQNQHTYTTIGSGIGLHLAKTLILLHHGSISAQNRTDSNGSCFTICIPLGKNHLRNDEIIEQPTNHHFTQQSLYVQEIKKNKKPIKNKTNFKVLIIDDDKEIRDYLVQVLGETYRTLEAANGEEGLQISLSKHPDLIISDVAMPVMDGFTLVKTLKGNSRVSHIPIILLTSKIENQDKIEGLEKGADAYISKPFDVDELLILANNLIKNRQMLKGKYSGAQDQEDKVKNIKFKSSDEILMERIMEIINENISDPALNVQILASKIGISRVQLHRKLKELAAISAGDFIRNIRMKQAANLLQKKKMNISQISYAVGFNSQTHFSTAFKKFYGVSPSEYINQEPVDETN